MDELKEEIFSNFELNEKERKFVDRCLTEKADCNKLIFIIDEMTSFHLQKDVLLAYLLYFLQKSDEQAANEIEFQLNASEKKLYETFKQLQDVQGFSKINEAEDIRRMFVAICQDVRVVIVKFATILYSLKQLNLPLTEQQHNFAKMVLEIFAPLAERLGLSHFKNEFEDTCFMLTEPEAYNQLKNDALMKKKDNQRQIEITRKKLVTILYDLNVKGEIQSRQKHFYSVYKKLVKKNITLGKIYDLVAMRVLVPTIEDCYAVLGKIHAIYKPIQGRVKDYIANPKPNGYQSLHTTIVADNMRPLEIQIRTFEMHKQCEYGVAAHWIYKERRTQNRFDQRMTWFRQKLENSNELSSSEFIESLKTELYGETIIAQTPKGKIIELPIGATIVDFAYAIHSEIGNKCVGGKINGKLVPISTELKNSDVVEILTNVNSKGPSPDWLNIVKSSSARSKIRAYFKNEMKEDNIRTGKAMLEQALKDRNLNISKQEKDAYLNQIANSLMFNETDMIFASLGAGSISANSIVGRIVNLYNNNKAVENKTSSITINKNKDGILVDGGTGLLIRYAGCCTPVLGDEIVGYISRGKGVTIHRKTCPNLKFLESERLITASWQSELVTNFTTKIKMETDNSSAAIKVLNNFAKGLKNKLKAFGYMQADDKTIFEIVVQIGSKAELDNIIKNIAALKAVRAVYRNE